MKCESSKTWLIGSLMLALGMAALAPRARANVYATDIRITGGTTNIDATAGTNIAISYRLNEPASLGTTVQLRSSSTVVNLFFPPETQGAFRGLNEVAWNGFATNGQAAPSGTYSVAVMPVSSGYTNWTQITSDSADQYTYVWDGRGIAVDQNPASVYYGRILVANGSTGPNPGSNPGDQVGILKLNADTSGAEEIVSSADLDGYNWLGESLSPWKLEVAPDDNVYVTDLARGGLVNRWDPTISSNSLVAVLRQDNLPAGAALSGPALTGASTNLQLWMADTNSARVIKWSLATNAVCAANDKGTVVVSNAGPNFFDVALDKSGNIYTCTFITETNNPSARVFRYPSFNPATNNGLPQTNADWAVGAGDDTYAGASGIAVDPSGTYVAVAFQGSAADLSLGSTNANTKILYATNGTIAANIDLGLRILNDPNHKDTEVAWDAVGNLYYIDFYWGSWRAVSPPGTNQSTSVASAQIQLTGGPPPPSSPSQITRVALSGANVTINFSADPNSLVSQFKIQGAATLSGTFTTIAGAQVSQISPGQFQASVPMSGPVQFYRVLQ